MSLRYATTITLILCLFVSSSHAENLIAVGWRTGMYAIDETTGTSRYVGSLGSAQFNSLAMNSAGDILSHNSNGRLVWLDPTDASQTLGPATADDVRGLAFAPDDTLYAITKPSGSTTTALYTIDVNDGSWVRLNSLPYGTSGLEFAADGTLYAWSLYRGLLVVDPVSGDWSELHDGDPANNSIQSICFAPDGTLYGVNNDLCTIDLDDEEIHPIAGDDLPDMRGMVWLPEPGTGLALLASFLVLARRR